MSVNGGSNGATELDVIEASIRAEFPISEPNALYRLLVRQAARTELYHRAVESTVEAVSELTERVRHLEGAQQTLPDGAE